MIFAQHENVSEPEPAILHEAWQNGLSRHTGLDDESSGGFQSARDGTQKSPDTVAIQISEAVTETVGNIELGNPGQFAHITQKPFNGAGFRARLSDRFFTRIDCRDSMAAHREFDGMTSVSTRDIQELAGRATVYSFLKKIDFRARLFGCNGAAPHFKRNAAKKVFLPIGLH